VYPSWQDKEGRYQELTTIIINGRKESRLQEIKGLTRQKATKQMIQKLASQYWLRARRDLRQPGKQ
jgi:hypothetical protein